MARIVLAVMLMLGLSSSALARIYYLNSRLDHALWPEHDPKLVVAGEILAGDKPGTIRLRVRGVILGAEFYKDKILDIPIGSFMWPEALVSSQKGTFCILVLLPSKEKQKEEYYLFTVVPGRKREYPRTADTKAARTILADELLAQLESEKSETRQRALLLQVAPILLKDKAAPVEKYLKSTDPWVRRSALSALVYATEDPKHLAALARDVQDFFSRTKRAEWVDGLEPGVKMSPKTLLLEHYFFLEKATWTWGTRWSEEEANKHLRILKGIQDEKVIEEWIQRRLLGK
jgi:hypothetical protein